MKKPEVTGKKVAAIAGRVLRMVEQSKKNRHPSDDQVVWANGAGELKVDEVAALAASALTQAPDRPKRKAAK